jgi:hypothetical protein
VRAPDGELLLPVAVHIGQEPERAREPFRIVEAQRRVGRLEEHSRPLDGPVSAQVEEEEAALRPNAAEGANRERGHGELGHPVTVEVGEGRERHAEPFARDQRRQRPRREAAHAVGEPGAVEHNAAVGHDSVVGSCGMNPQDVDEAGPDGRLVGAHDQLHLAIAVNVDRCKRRAIVGGVSR